MNKTKILIGNSFPLSLIRCAVTIVPCSRQELLQRLCDTEPVSFWGHRNTLNAANCYLGKNLTPATERPVLALSPSKKPVLDGVEYSECWIISPDYRGNFRPAIGMEVTPEQIKSWQCLKITFNY